MFPPTLNPTAEWRSTEDLKVILISKDRRLTRKLALEFFEGYGKVRECYIIQSKTTIIGYGMFTTEKEAEEALKQTRIQLGGFHGVCCDVTTFKSGNRKIYISSLALPEEVIRSYFESNYGCILRYELLPDRSAVFILFLKVDSAVACRNKHHRINGITLFVRPGYHPGNNFQLDRSTSMYRVTPSISVAYNYNGYSSLHNFKSSFNLSSPQYRYSSFPSPIQIDSHSFQTELPPSSGLSSSHSEIVHSDSSFASCLADTFPKFHPLLKELEDLSIAEIDGKRKRKKKVVDNEELILKWRSAHVESNEGTIEPVVDEKEQQREEIMESLNLPTINDGAHYARDSEGLPIHYNGNYIHSIFKDGRFRFKVYKHVTFDTSKNTMKLFERAAEEYEFFGPRNPCKAENGLIRCDEDDIERWEDESEMSIFTYKDTEGFPNHLKWPFDFPSKPRHIPLMDKSTYEDNTSLDINLAVRYMDHLVERWQNANQHKFVSTFTPFLREYCTVCEVKLDKPTMRFDHIFSRAHLVKLNHNNVKYCPSDFYFWNNVLVYNFEMGHRKSRARGRTSR